MRVRAIRAKMAITKGFGFILHIPPNNSLQGAQLFTAMRCCFAFKSLNQTGRRKKLSHLGLAEIFEKLLF